MRDPRIERLAKNLINYSCSLGKGEKVLIENIGLEPELVCALVDQAYAAGGIPLVTIKDKSVQRSLLMNTSVEQTRLAAKFELDRMAEVDAYIGIRAGDNIYSDADVSEDKQQIYAQHFWQPVHGQQRVPHTKWVVLRYPSASMAQLAGMSTQAFEDFYFKVCNLDYAQLSRAMDPLVERMKAADMVRIIGKGTDIMFSIKGMNAIKCAGLRNIPDGEVYTAPVKNSVNGKISYNTPSVKNGFSFENIVLEFKDGKIINATGNNTSVLNNILDTDEGARYIGEFALGVNPYIKNAMKDTLFDEKISGSFHFTPGSSYDECPNGNKSAIHWDMVCIQTPEFGGGEIWFDDKLIRKDGIFVQDDLAGLNPDAFV